MSGTRVTTMSDPLIAPRTQAHQEDAEHDDDARTASLWPFIRTADVTLVRAMIEPTDRSIPPEITTIAWATAANAMGRAPIARFWSSGAP